MTELALALSVPLPLGCVAGVCGADGEWWLCVACPCASRLEWLGLRELSENVLERLVKGFMAILKSECMLRDAWLPLCTNVSPECVLVVLGATNESLLSGLGARLFVRLGRRLGKREWGRLPPGDDDEAASGGVRTDGEVLAGGEVFAGGGGTCTGISGASRLRLRRSSVLTHSSGAASGVGSCGR